MKISAITRRIKSAMKRFGRKDEPRWTYNQDGLASMHNCDFMSDSRFMEAYEAAERTGSWGNSRVHWRAHVAAWAGEHCMGITGDFVECGVNRGGLAMVVMKYARLHAADRKFYLLDTFEGLDDRYISAEERALGRRSGGYSECWEAVQATFRDYKNVCLVRGAVPATLDRVPASRIAYLSIDMNCREPEIAAATYFWPKLSEGAIVLLDDYGWQAHRYQKEAFDEFAKERGVGILCLPTGQGIIIKPRVPNG